MTFFLKGSLSLEEYAHVRRYLNRRAILTRRLFAGTVAVGLVVIGIVHAPLYFSMAAIVAAALAVEPFLFHRRAKRKWKRQPAASRFIDLEFSEEGYRIVDDEGNPAAFHWDRIHKWKETEKMFLLYFSPKLPAVVPKRLLTASPPTADTESAFRELLRTCVG